MPPPFVTTLGTRWHGGAWPALFAPRALHSSFYRPKECELNGFAFGTVANHSVIKIKETLR